MFQPLQNFHCNIIIWLWASTVTLMSDCRAQCRLDPTRPNYTRLLKFGPFWEVSVKYFFFQTSFVVPAGNIPGRLGMLVTLFLCLVNTLNSVSETSPNTQTIPTAIVMWVILCMLFVLAALVCYAWILYKESHGCPESKVFAKKINVTSADGKKPEGGPNARFSQNTDKILLIVFPVIYSIATLIFFGVYKSV